MVQPVKPKAKSSRTQKQPTEEMVPRKH